MAAPKRIKKPVRPDLSRADAERIASACAGLINARRARTAELDDALQAIRQEYEPILADLDQAIDAHYEALRAWADAHPEEFSLRRSVDFVTAVVGYRTGKHKCSPVKGATLQQALDSVLEGGPMGWVRTKRELDREKIISLYTDGKISESDLAERKLRIVQDETFYVDPRLTDTPDTATATREVQS